MRSKSSSFWLTFVDHTLELFGYTQVYTNKQRNDFVDYWTYSHRSDCSSKVYSRDLHYCKSPWCKYLQSSLSNLMLCQKTEKEAVYRVFNEYCLYDQIEDIVKNVKSNPPAIGNKLHKNNTTKSKDQTQDNESVSADFQEAFRLCLEIMQYSLQHAPQYLRQHLISHRQKVLKYPFLTFLVECIFQHQTEKMNLTLVWISFS